MGNELKKILNMCTDLIKLCDQVFYYGNKQSDYKMQNVIINITGKLEVLDQNLSNINSEVFNEKNNKLVEIISTFVSAQMLGDYIKQKDIVSSGLKEWLVDLIGLLRDNGVYEELIEHQIDIHNGDNYIENCKNNMLMKMIPDDYMLEECPMGLFTLKKKMTMSEDIYYFHSIKDPYLESMYLAENYYNCCKLTGKYGEKKIVIYGLGLGYHIEALSSFQDISEIIVFESDINILRIVARYFNIIEKLQDRVRIVYDPDLSDFSKTISCGEYNIFFHRPSINNISNQSLKKVMNEYYMSYSSVYEQQNQLIGNFVKNIKYEDENIFKEKVNFTGKTLILIAGGPSLDMELQLIKSIYSQRSLECYRDCILMCVGTVYKKLAAENIFPDYVIMTDSQSNMVSQIDNCVNQNSKLIYLSTVYYGVLDKWKGKRYIALQNDFNYAREYASEKGEPECMLETGGSVSTTAFDLGMKMGCGKIITVGLDLAYVNCKRGSAGTKQSNDVNKADCNVFVKSVDGDEIPTSVNLEIYRKWIEMRIKHRTQNERNIKLFNASKGANIYGMINTSLENAINN